MPDTPDNTPDTADNNGDKKPGFAARCRIMFKKAAAQDWKGVIKDTAKDLKDPKEIALLAGSSIVPGGWVAYGGYRIAKFAAKNQAPETPPANDNHTEALPEKKKKPKAPKA